MCLDFQVQSFSGCAIIKGNANFKDNTKLWFVMFEAIS